MLPPSCRVVPPNLCNRPLPWSDRLPWPEHDRTMLLAEQLVGEARERRRRRMSRLERMLNAASAGAFVLVAIAIAILVPDERSVDPLLILGLVAGYAIVSRVRFEFGSMYVTPEQLMFIPM